MSETLTLKERADKAEKAFLAHIRQENEYKEKCDMQAKKEGRYRADGKILYTREERFMFTYLSKIRNRLYLEYALLEEMYEKEQKRG